MKQHHNQSALSLKTIRYLNWAPYDMIERNFPLRQKVVLEVLGKQFLRWGSLEKENLKLNLPSTVAHNCHGKIFFVTAKSQLWATVDYRILSRKLFNNEI